jgi:hypothetical protein
MTAQQIPIGPSAVVYGRRAGPSVTILADVGYTRLGIVNVAFVGSPQNWFLVYAGLTAESAAARLAALQPELLLLGHGRPLSPPCAALWMTWQPPSRRPQFRTAALSRLPRFSAAYHRRSIKPGTLTSGRCLPRRLRYSRRVLSPLPLDREAEQDHGVRQSEEGRIKRRQQLELGPHAGRTYSTV